MPSSFLLIGGTSGISSSVAKKLCVQNYNIITISRSKKSLEPALNLKHYSADITDSTSELPDIKEPLSGLVYFPGTINLKPFKNLSEDDYRNDWEINFLGAIRIIRRYLPQFSKTEQNSIVLMSSIAVKQGMAYHASIAGAKGAIEGLTRSLAAELAPATRVNAVAPSLTNTPLAQHLLNEERKRDHACKRHPLQCIGNPDDISEMIVFLLSKKSRWITGQIVHVDGGLSTIKTL